MRELSWCIVLLETTAGLELPGGCRRFPRHYLLASPALELHEASQPGMEFMPSYPPFKKASPALELHEAQPRIKFMPSFGEAGDKQKKRSSPVLEGIPGIRTS